MFSACLAVGGAIILAVLLFDAMVSHKDSDILVFLGALDAVCACLLAGWYISWLIWREET
jgi:hypothetical protein